jgi:hypothetical protein
MNSKLILLALGLAPALLSCTAQPATYTDYALASLATETNETNEANKTNEADGTHIETYSCAPVPESVDFCGERIDLTRFDRRERMDRELMAFTYMHNNSLLMLKRANRYFPVIEPILKEEGVPDDFKYLMVIESSVNIQARSAAGAAGLWQFMPTTAKEYGLEVNDFVDERFHVEKATRAACKYLRRAHAKYKDWIAVAASYNAGQGRITQQIERQGTSQTLDLLLAEETSRYVYRIFCAKIMFQHPAAFGYSLRASDLYPVIPCQQLTVTTPLTDLAKFAQKHGINQALLRQFNPWLRSNSLPNRSGKSYVILIPTQEGMYIKPQDIKAHDPRWVVE